jgi:phosphatidylinositol-bisphosphatase
MSLIWSNKSRWEQQVQAHLGDDFRMIGAQNMSAIHVMVFLHRDLWAYCWNIKTGLVATGFANWVGNKGGTQVGFNLGHTSILFINAHLAAHANKMKERTQSLARILMESPLHRDRKSQAGIQAEYDRVFFMGDLNPRLDATRAEVDVWLETKNLEKCLETDQLLKLLQGDPDTAQRDGPSGFWPLFDEAAIHFPPTYKFDSHSDMYDTSKKQRVPSWTDRILWKRDSDVKVLSYCSVSSLRSSDHRPVLAQFEIAINLDHWQGPPLQSKKSSICALQ